MLAPYILSLEMIGNAMADEFLFAHQHKMGPCLRPMGKLVSHGLFAHGNLRAITVTADLVNGTCGGLSRDEAIELARLCADDPALCRVALRIWREFVFPAFKKPWAVSYQDETLHSGNTYRLDGWMKIAVKQHSGTDPRSGRTGRDKTVWTWTKDSAALRDRRVPSPPSMAQRIGEKEYRSWSVGR